MFARAMLRRALPFAVRWRLRAGWRSLADYRSGTRLATRRGSPEDYPYEICGYERPLICYAGQEAAFASKRGNCELALHAISGLVIAPQETFSFWRCVGYPTAQAGYGAAAALKAGRLTTEIGGALCLASTLIYNVGLLSGMSIVERRCHSIDQYGAARYFELGRDAAVEFAYLDLRFRNDFSTPILLTTTIRPSAIVATARSAQDIALDVAIVACPERGVAGELRVGTTRTVRRDGYQGSAEYLGTSVYKLGY